MRYRERPVEVEAMRFVGVSTNEMERWLGDAFESWLPSLGALLIHALDGEVQVQAGEWVVRGIAGEVYVCTPTYFHRTFEAIEAGA